MSESYVTLRAELLAKAIKFCIEQSTGPMVNSFSPGDSDSLEAIATAIAESRPIEIVY